MDKKFLFGFLGGLIIGTALIWVGLFLKFKIQKSNFINQPLPHVVAEEVVDNSGNLLKSPEKEILTSKKDLCGLLKKEDINEVININLTRSEKDENYPFGNCLYFNDLSSRPIIVFNDVGFEFEEIKELQNKVGSEFKDLLGLADSAFFGSIVDVNDKNNKFNSIYLKKNNFVYSIGGLNINEEQLRLVVNLIINNL